MCPTKCHRDKSLAPVNPASRSTLLCPRPLAVSVQEKIVAVPIPHQILCKDAPPKARHDSGDLSEVLCSRMSRIRLLTCCSDAAPWPHGIVSAAVRRSPPRWELRPRRALAAPLQDTHTHTRSHKEEIQNRRIQKANPSTSEREMVFQTNVTLCGQTEKHKERPRQTHETTQQRNTKHATRVTQNKTRQEKTGQDETRRDETGQVHIQSERTFTDISA